MSSTSLKKVTHLIFDLDGTLINTQHLYERAMNNAVGLFRKECSPELHIKTATMNVQDACKMIVGELNITSTTEEFMKKYFAEAQKIVGDNQLQPGAEKLIRHLKHFNIPFAVATTSDEKLFAIKSKKHQEFFKLFDHVVYGNDPGITKTKPSPDIYLVAAKKFAEKPSPSQCLVFEDTPNGVDAALAAGMQVALIPAKHVTLQQTQNATVILRNIAEIDLKAFGLPPLARDV